MEVLLGSIVATASEFAPELLAPRIMKLLLVGDLSAACSNWGSEDSSGEDTSRAVKGFAVEIG